MTSPSGRYNPRSAGAGQPAPGDRRLDRPLAPAVTDAPAGKIEPRWIVELKNLLPRDDLPPGAPWELSVSSVVAPYLPKLLRRHARVLDRLGRVRLDPQSISLDSDEEIDWDKIIEIRTLPLLDVFNTATIDGANSYVARLLPPIPGVTKRATGWLFAKVADLLLTLFITASQDHGERAAEVQVPFEIVYRGSFRRRMTVRAGLFAAAVVSTPPVTRHVLATATANGVSIVPAPPTVDYALSRDRAGMLRGRIALATERVADLRRSPVLADDDGNGTNRG